MTAFDAQGYPKEGCQHRILERSFLWKNLWTYIIIDLILF